MSWSRPRSEERMSLFGSWHLGLQNASKSSGAVKIDQIWQVLGPIAVKQDFRVRVRPRNIYPSIARIPVRCVSWLVSAECWHWLVWLCVWSIQKSLPAMQIDNFGVQVLSQLCNGGELHWDWIPNSSWFFRAICGDGDWFTSRFHPLHCSQLDPAIERISSESICDSQGLAGMLNSLEDSIHVLILRDNSLVISSAEMKFGAHSDAFWWFLAFKTL